MPKDAKEIIKDFLEVAEEKTERRTKRKWPKIALIVFLCVFFLTVVKAGFLFGYREFYKNKIYPGVYAESFHIGGITREEARDLVENYNNRLVREGIDFSVIKIDGERVDFKLNNLDAGDSQELVKVDGEQLVAQAFQIGRDGHWFSNLWRPVALRVVWPKVLNPAVVLDEMALREELKTYLAPLENGGRDANIKITNLETFSYEVVPEHAGGIFSYEEIAPLTRATVSGLSFAPIEIRQKEFQPTIVSDDAVKASENLSSLFSFGDLGLHFVNPQTKIRRNWNIGSAQYAEWLEVARDTDNNLIFILSEEKVKNYLDILRTDIDSPAQNAKFVVDNGRVKEFQASKTGLRLDLEATYQAINNAFKERNYRPDTVTKTVGLMVEMVEPQIKMTDVNNLGIEEIIGSGYSTFLDSHTNRIKNIANAVKLLNGTLIKPGEVFSANAYAGPYTLENGFLPEAVIKGREIKNEVGGGMCQIGTTLFRMAMNSGMDIVQRQNHSLVVSYYADPVNKNPGTDAALYEPTVDLKFLNDTGQYLLLQTEIDYEKQMLIFTLWGKSDGRSGSYTHPEVSKWIPYNKTVENILVSNDPLVKPGVTKCQTAYNGAVASFTYTRTTPDGTKIDRVFESYYRPLPKICLVGVEQIPEGCKEREPCEIKDESVVPEEPLPVVEE